MDRFTILSKYASENDEYFVYLAIPDIQGTIYQWMKLTPCEPPYPIEEEN